MKMLISLLTSLLFSSSVFAILEIRTGDVIVQQLKCWSCQIIADETGSKYNQSGVVLIDKDHQVFIAQSLGKGVHIIPLNEFLKQGDLELLLRTYELDQLFNTDKNTFANFEKKIWATYRRDFQGLSFDRNFLWDNRDDKGREKLYCSEFITKLINNFLNTKIRPRPMNFERNRSFWENYFNGNVPDGKLGNSPADFTRSPLFFAVRLLPESF